MGLRKWFSGVAIKQKVETDPRYQEAVTFAQTYEPNSGIEYDWVADHALEEYKRLEGTVEVIESKADSLIRYLGAGSGLIALAFAYSVPDRGWLGIIQIFPALFALLVAIFYAARARTPEKLPMPLHTKSAFKYADAYSATVARASFAAMTGAAAFGLALAATEKARLVRWAFRLFIFAVSWLVLMAAIIAALSFGRGLLVLPNFVW